MKIILMFLLLIPYSTLFSQNEDEENEEVWYSKFQISSTIDDKDKPAELSLTVPNEGQYSYQLNSTLIYNVTKTDGLIFFKSVLSPFVGYYRNTLTNSKRNQLQYGISYILSFNDLIKESSTPQLLINAKNNRNFENNTLSFILNLNESFLTNIRETVGNHLLPQDKPSSIYDLLDYSYKPYWGIEYDNRVLTFGPDNDTLIGTVVRCYFRFSSTVYILPKLFNNLLEIDFDYKWRQNVVNNRKDQTQTVFRFYNLGANLVLLEKPSFKIGLSYIWGSDPVENYKDEKLLKLNIKFGYP